MFPTQIHTKHQAVKQSSDEILTKLRKFITSYPQPDHPPPVPTYTWSTISALETSLLITIVSTSVRLHEILNASGPVLDQASITLLKTTHKRWNGIFEHASVCCDVLNQIRHGISHGDPGLLVVILNALKYVRDRKNPMLLTVEGGIEERREWVWGCGVYVEDVMGVMERAGEVVRGAGFE